jgi:TIR domain/Pentapeptide repeats (8 copies)
MANERQLAILGGGVKAWNRWHEKNPFVDVNLTRANLRGADLHNVEFDNAVLNQTDFSGANLTGAHFEAADLKETDLRNANLDGAHFLYANLSGANLEGAILTNTNLVSVNLKCADMGRAKLMGAYLLDADLTDANLTNSVVGVSPIGETDFARVDLSLVRGLEEVVHIASSVISIDTIYLSGGNIPEIFLRLCGVPKEMIEFAHSLRGTSFKLYSCFISHSAKDKRFCERLYADLQAKGVRVWYFPEDAKWGETVWGEIDRSIKVYDKLIVVLSENSLQSGPVNREIERALNREDKEGKGILFPIRIDDYIFDTWEHERKADVLRKVVGDFSGWDKDAAKYDKAFDKLLKGLQAGA